MKVLIALTAILVMLLASPWVAAIDPGGAPNPDGGQTGGTGDDPGDGHGDGHSDDDYVIGQVIVELQPDVAIDEIIEEYDIFVVGTIEPQHLYLVEIPFDWDEEDFEDFAEDDDRIVEVEQNDNSEVPEGQTQSFFVAVPEDLYGGQYAGPRINLNPALDVSTGVGIIVAVLDTGIDPEHPHLVSRIAPGGYDFVDLDPDAFEPEIGPMRGHGTHIAGLVAYVAPGASLLPIRVLDADGRGDAFRIAQAIYLAIDEGASIINMSFAARDPNAIVSSAINDARAAGVLIVSAAGNIDESAPIDFYPALDSKVIGVVATDAADSKSTFSNFGTKMSISAPGTDMISTIPGGGYASWSGTSMATAIVSGASALIRAAEPAATPPVIELILFESAQSIDDLNPAFETQLGAGRLDVAAALGLEPTATPFLADVNGDTVVDIDDLVAVIIGWGVCTTQAECLADLTGDGLVNIDDVMAVVLNFD